MGGRPPTVRGLEAARLLGRARRLAGSLSRPTRARPRTQNPSRARALQGVNWRTTAAWSGADRRCIGRAPGRGRASSPSRRAVPRAIAGQQPPRLAGALAKSMLHPPPYATQPASIHRRRCRTGATRARRTAHGASQKVRTHRRHARARAHGHMGEPLAHWHLTPCPQRTAPKRPARAALRRPRRRSDRRPVLSVVRRSLVQVLRLVSEDAVSASQSAARARSAGRWTVRSAAASDQDAHCVGLSPGARNTSAHTGQ